MMKIKFLALTMSLFFTMAMFQVQGQDNGKKHKIVFAFTNADSMQQKAFVQQLKNLRDEWPKATIEVVAYNNGIDLLMATNKKYEADLQQLVASGVVFDVCNKTLKRKNIDPTKLFTFAKVVPAGIAHIVLREEKDYSYIKGGF